MSGSTVEQTEALFSPLQVGDILVPNRIQMSALTRNRAPEAVPSDLMATYYGQRAKGGVGLIVSEATLITQQGYDAAISCHDNLWLTFEHALQDRMGEYAWSLEL